MALSGTFEDAEISAPLVGLYNWCELLSKLIQGVSSLVKVVVAVINTLYPSDFMIQAALCYMARYAQRG